MYVLDAAELSNKYLNGKTIIIEKRKKIINNLKTQSNLNFEKDT